MKKKYLLILLIVFIKTTIFSQTDTLKKETVFVLVEQMPEFRGGTTEMMNFIVKNINYPQKEKEEEIGGTCYVTFVVEKDGSISNVALLRGVPGGARSWPGSHESSFYNAKMDPGKTKWS